MKEQEPRLSIFFHNYYGDDSNWLSFFQRQIPIPFQLFYNAVIDSYYRIGEDQPSSEVGIFTQPKRTYFTSSSNIGKDIGGKLVLMDAYQKLEQPSEFIMLLHDKHSPYHHNRDKWKEQLFRIAEPAVLATIIDMFDQQKDVGIIAAGNAIYSEVNNTRRSMDYIDSELVTRLLSEYKIQPPGLQFVAGTMFCVRARLFEEFFRVHLPLNIRATLEHGNVTDNEGPTITHCWERLLCWLVTSQGYQIKGI